MNRRARKEEKERKEELPQQCISTIRPEQQRPSTPHLRLLYVIGMPDKHDLAQHVVDVDYYHSEHGGYLHLILASSNCGDTLGMLISTGTK